MTAPETSSATGAMVDQQRVPGRRLVVSMYLLTAAAGASWGVWYFLNGGGSVVVSYTIDDDPRAALAAGQLQFLVQAIALLGSQLGFLIPAVARRLSSVAAATVAIAAGIVSVLELLASGWLGLVGSLHWDGDDLQGLTLIVSFAIVWSMPPLALTAGAVAVWLRLATPARPGAAGVVVAATLALVSLSMVLVGLH